MKHSDIDPPMPRWLSSFFFGTLLMLGTMTLMHCDSKKKPESKEEQTQETLQAPTTDLHSTPSTHAEAGTTSDAHSTHVGSTNDIA